MSVPVIRWIMTDKITGRWVASVYAEKYEKASETDPTDTFHFWLGGNVVASVDKTSGVNVGDSGGRLVVTA